VRRKAFARVSRTPGRTREINFFQVNDELVLVDLPGYGFARVARAQREQWQPLIEGYLRGSERLQGVVLLLDIRRDPSDEDRTLLEFLAELGVPTIVVVTKIDKLGTSALAQRLDAIARSIALGEDQIVPFSAVTGRGRDELASAIVELVNQPSWRPA
jgi:GTP-binding protein